MKHIYAFVLILLVSYGYCQTPTKKVKPEYKTRKYAGEYGYGGNIEKGSRVGYITVYPESDTIILFYFESNRGAPSYNMGSLYGRAKIVNDTGVFYSNVYSDKGCKFGFKFSRDKLTLKTIDDLDNCGFGHAVFIDGTFKQSSTKIPLSFKNLESTEIFFNKTSPENYLK